MRKATFVRKYYGHGYDAHMVYLDYMYRGHEYTLTSSPRFKPGDSSYRFAVGEVLVSKRLPRIRV